MDKLSNDLKIHTYSNLLHYLTSSGLVFTQALKGLQGCAINS